MDILERVSTLEKTVERHSNRLVVVEESISKDHKTLETVRKDVDEMKKQITSVEKDVKAIMTQGDKTNASIASLTKWVKFALGVAVVAFTYSVIRNESVASGVATLISTIAKLGI